MNDLISRKNILSDIEENIKNGESEHEDLAVMMLEMIKKYIEEFPAADVQPVKHGVWQENDQGYYDIYVECSECGLNLNISDYISDEWREILKYCPCCGARMDGDKE